jgi:hypothetical protein
MHSVLQETTVSSEMVQICHISVEAYDIKITSCIVTSMGSPVGVHKSVYFASHNISICEDIAIKMHSI